MKKLLFALPILFLSAMPAEAARRHNTPDYRLVCDQHGCVVKFKQPKIRISDDCVYKPWRERIICRY